MVGGDFEGRELLFFFVGFRLVLRGLLVDVVGSSILALLGATGGSFDFSPSLPLLGERLPDSGSRLQSECTSGPRRGCLLSW